MIVILLWEEHRVEVSVNPEVTIDEFLHEEAQEFFGFAWVLAQKAKAENKTPEEAMAERQANGLWEKTIKRQIGITYEIEKDNGASEEELAQYPRLADDEMRVFRHIKKKDGVLNETLLDGERTLHAYAITGKPTLRVTIEKRPKTLKIFKKADSLIVTDCDTGMEHSVTLGGKDHLTMKDIKDQIKSTCSERPGETVMFRLSNGRVLEPEDDNLNMKEISAHMDDVAEQPQKIKAEASQRSRRNSKPGRPRGESASNQAPVAPQWAEMPTVFEIGSYCCKAGYAGDAQPRAVEPSIKGVPKETLNVNMFSGLGQNCEAPVCSNVWEAKQYNGVYCLLGDTPDWTSLERIWSHVFYTKMAHRPEFSPVLVTLPVLCSDGFKQNLCRSLFDHLGFCGCYFVVSSVTPLRSMGIDTGLVVDIGFNNTFIAPVVNGTFMPGMVQRLMSHQNREVKVGGHLMATQLVHAMHLQGMVGSSSEKDCRILRSALQVFEEHCYVSPDPEAEVDAGEAGFTRIMMSIGNDNKVFKMGNERWQLPEGLFLGKTVGKKTVTGLDAGIVEAIRSCDVDLRSDLFRNIVLAGGLSRLKGLKERLERELPGRVPKAVFRVFVAGDHSHFAGASKMAFDLKMDAWISAEEYEKHGPTIHRQKCMDA